MLLLKLNKVIFDLRPTKAAVTVYGSKASEGRDDKSISERLNTFFDTIEAFTAKFLQSCPSRLLISKGCERLYETTHIE